MEGNTIPLLVTGIFVLAAFLSAGLIWRVISSMTKGVALLLQVTIALAAIGFVIWFSQNPQGNMESLSYWLGVVAALSSQIYKAVKFLVNSLGAIL